MSALSAISLSCCSDIVHLDRFYRLQEMFRVNIKVFKDRNKVDIILNEFVFVLAIYSIDHQVAIVPFLHLCNFNKAIRSLKPYSSPVKGEGYVTSVIRQDCLRIDHAHNIHYSLAKGNLDWLGFTCVRWRRTFVARRVSGSISRVHSIMQVFFCKTSQASVAADELAQSDMIERREFL